MCLIQSACGHAEGSWAARGVAVAVFECVEEANRGEGDGREAEGFDVLDMDFFDEESLAVVYRAGDRTGELVSVSLCALTGRGDIKFTGCANRFASGLG